MKAWVRAVVLIPLALLVLLLTWFIVAALCVDTRGYEEIGAPIGTPYDETANESVVGPPLTLSEAFARIDRGQVTWIDVLPDSWPDGDRRWYWELESDGSLERRWPVEGRYVLIDGIPILSTVGQSVGLTEDEWTELLERVSAYNQDATLKITVIDDMENFGTDRPPEEYTP